MQRQRPQQLGDAARRQAIAAVRPFGQRLAVAAIGAVGPGLVGQIAARQRRPGPEEPIDRAAPRQEALQRRGGQRRSRGGAGEAIDDEAGGVIARLADHRGERAIELGAGRQALLLLPAMGGDQERQLGHAGGGEIDVVAMAGPARALAQRNDQRGGGPVAIHPRRRQRRLQGGRGIEARRGKFVVVEDHEKSSSRADLTCIGERKSH